MAGYLYVMANQGMPGLYKVGFTTRSLKSRERELSAHEGVPYPFYTRFAIQLKRPERAEKAAHLMYKCCRVYTQKEFFRFDRDDELGFFLDNLVSICVMIHNGFDELDAIATAAKQGITVCGLDEADIRRLYPEVDVTVLDDCNGFDLPKVIGEYPNTDNLISASF